MMWTFSRRLISYNRLVSPNFRRNDVIVGCFNSKPCFSQGKSDDAKDELCKVLRSSEPVSTEVASDAECPAKLTGKICKSDILVALSRFNKIENRALCSEYGLNGKFSTIQTNMHHSNIKHLHFQNIFRRNHLPVFAIIVMISALFRLNYITNSMILSMVMHILMTYFHIS